MTDYLLLEPENAIELADDSQVCWLDAEGICRRLDLSECAGQLQVRPVVRGLPVEVVSAFLVKLPVVRKRWIRQALPFGVEEMLAEEVELFHLALGRQQADGQ